MFSLYVKVIVHLKMKVLYSFSHPHVIPNLWDFLSSGEHKGRRVRMEGKNVCNQTTVAPIDSYST